MKLERVRKSQIIKDQLDANGGFRPYFIESPLKCLFGIQGKDGMNLEDLRPKVE